MVAVKTVASAAEVILKQRRRRRRFRQLGASPRRRIQVRDIFKQVGPLFFRRAYRMKYGSFCKIARKLHNHIMLASRKNCSPNTRKNYRHVPNGPITTSVRLACALRYFAGASAYDIMTTYQIGYVDTIMSVWYVVQSINSNPDFNISYPSNHEEQRAVAKGFQEVSVAGFDCCAGAIDGILIWIHNNNTYNY